MVVNNTMRNSHSLTDGVEYDVVRMANDEEDHTVVVALDEVSAAAAAV